MTIKALSEVTSGDVLTFLGTLVAASLALVSVVYTQRASKRLAAEQARAALTSRSQELEANAYARARESYEAAIRQYEENQRSYEADKRRLNARVAHAEMVARHAEHRIDLLETCMRDAGMTVPPYDPIPED